MQMFLKKNYQVVKAAGYENCRQHYFTMHCFYTE